MVAGRSERDLCALKRGCGGYFGPRTHAANAGLSAIPSERSPHTHVISPTFTRAISYEWRVALGRVIEPKGCTQIHADLTGLLQNKITGHP